MATVFIPTPLRKFTGNISKIELEAQSIGELLDSLSIKHPELKNTFILLKGKYLPSSIFL